MKNFSVVVVDDNTVSRCLPRFILRPFAAYIEVFECGTGFDALDLIAANQITHLLLDISMPDMDGIKVAKMIRAASQHSEIRLIAYTADVFCKDVAYLKSVGFDDVIVKPLKSSDLLHALGILNT